MPDVLRHAPPAPAPHRLSAPSVHVDPITERHLEHRIEVAERDAFARGEQAGRAAAEQAADRAARAIVAAIDRWTEEVREQREAATARNLDLVALVSRAVVGASPPTSANLLADRIRTAVDSLQAPDLTVHVHPQDADAVRVALDADPSTTVLHVVADARRSPGDAVVEGGHCGARLTRDALLQIAIELVGEEPDVGGAG